jgi:hypothetical protein
MIFFNFFLNVVVQLFTVRDGGKWEGGTHMSTNTERASGVGDAPLESSLLESSLSDPASLCEPLDASQCLGAVPASDNAAPRGEQQEPAGTETSTTAIASEAGHDDEIASLKAEIENLRKLSAPVANKRAQNAEQHRPIGARLTVQTSSNSLRSTSFADKYAKQDPSVSPAQHRASEIQRVLREARAARAAADQANWIKEKLAENSPDWKKIVRHHLGSNGDKVDEIRVAREAWMLERHRGSDGAHALGKLSTELEDMRHILTSIARTIPHGVSPIASSMGFHTPLGSRNTSPQQPSINYVRTHQSPILALQSPTARAAHVNQICHAESASGLVNEAEELYKKLFGQYPSRQSLIDFCSETMRINIRPFLAAPTPERSNARRSLGDLTPSSSAASNNPGAWDAANGSWADLQCNVCGSPIAKNLGTRGFLTDSPSVHSTIAQGDEYLAPIPVLSRADCGGLDTELRDQHSGSLASSSAMFGIAPSCQPDAQAIRLVQPPWNKTQYSPPITPRLLDDGNRADACIACAGSSVEFPESPKCPSRQTSWTQVTG